MDGTKFEAKRPRQDHHNHGYTTKNSTQLWGHTRQLGFRPGEFIYSSMLMFMLVPIPMRMLLFMLMIMLILMPMPTNMRYAYAYVYAYANAYASARA